MPKDFSCELPLGFLLPRTPRIDWPFDTHLQTRKRIGIHRRCTALGTILPFSRRTGEGAGDEGWLAVPGISIRPRHAAHRAPFASLFFR